MRPDFWAKVSRLRLAARSTARKERRSVAPGLTEAPKAEMTMSTSSKMCWMARVEVASASTTSLA